MRTSLIALGALCAVSLMPTTAAAQTWAPTDREAPELYWSKPRPVPPPFTTATDEFDVDGTSGGFAYLEARPPAEDDLHDGVWVTLLTRVSFTDLDQNTEIPYAIRTNPDLDDAPVYAWDDDGDPTTDDHPPVIVSQSRFDALIDAIDDDPNGVFEEVTKRFQPFVTGSPAAATTARWDAMYPHWPANATRAYWRNVDIPQTGQVFNLEEIIKRTITDQTGGAVDGEDFYYRYGHTAYDDSAMTLEIQVLYVHGNPNPTFNDDPVPVGPTGGFKVGTSTPLTYIAFDSGTPPIPSTSYPAGVGFTPVTGNAFIQPGSGFEFKATLIGISGTGQDQVTSSVRVVLSVPGGPTWEDPNPWWIYKLAGEPPKVHCPAWVPINTIVKLKRFETPYLPVDPLPVADQEVYYVGN